MSQEDNSPLRSRRVSSGTQSGGKPGSADRRPLQFWRVFNSWWRQNLEHTGRRPGSDDITRWYELQADIVWGPDKPSLQETRTHAKCLRTVSSVREYFREYRKKKYEYTGSEDDDEDVVTRRGSTPAGIGAAEATESDAALFSYSRRPSRDSGTPGTSPALGMTSAFASSLDLQDSGSWQSSLMYSSSVAAHSSRGGRTGRGRGRGRGRQFCSIETAYEIHPGALGPEVLDAGPNAAHTATGAQPQISQQRPLSQLSGGYGGPNMQSYVMLQTTATVPTALSGGQVPQDPWLNSRMTGQMQAAGISSQGFQAADTVGSDVMPMPVLKEENSGIDLSYAAPWVQEQQHMQHNGMFVPMQYVQQQQQLVTAGDGGAGVLSSSQGLPSIQGQTGAVAAGQPYMQHCASGTASATVAVVNEAASSAPPKPDANRSTAEEGLLPMPGNFLAQFTSPPQQPQQAHEQYAVPPPPLWSQSESVEQQQVQMQHTRQPAATSAFHSIPEQHSHVQEQAPWSQQQQPLNQQQQQASELQQQVSQRPPPPLQLQHQSSLQLQHDLHQLHQQFAQDSTRATPRGFPMLFSDNTNLGCDDIIPPPPLFSSRHNSTELAQMGMAGGVACSTSMQQQQQQRGAAAPRASTGHNSAGILSELEAIKGPAMAGLVDAHCASQQQRISVSALLDAGPYTIMGRRLSQGLDLGGLGNALSMPNQRLSLYAMGSDFLGDLLGDCLGDLDTFLGTMAVAGGGSAAANEPVQLPRISDGGCGVMAPPPASAGRSSFRWANPSGATLAAPSCGAAASACQQAMGHSRAPPVLNTNGASTITSDGLALHLSSPTLGAACLISPLASRRTAAVAIDGSSARLPSGCKRNRGSSSQIHAGLVLDVNLIKRQRVSGLLMDMDTPKVRAMTAGVGGTAPTPPSPAVTPNRIAALAAALANAAAAARAETTSSKGDADKDRSAINTTTEKRHEAGSHKFVLDLGDPPSSREVPGQQQQQQQVRVLPGPAFHHLFSGGSMQPAKHKNPSAAVGREQLQAVAAESAAEAGIQGIGKAWVLNLGDEPTPKAHAQAAVAAASAASSSSGVNTGTKSGRGLLPPLHEIEKMI